MDNYLVEEKSRTALHINRSQLYSTLASRSAVSATINALPAWPVSKDHTLAPKTKVHGDDMSIKEKVSKDAWNRGMAALQEINTLIEEAEHRHTSRLGSQFALGSGDGGSRISVGSNSREERDDHSSRQECVIRIAKQLPEEDNQQARSLTTNEDRDNLKWTLLSLSLNPEME
ncbi:hypothetical protein R1sor_021348 [Riccia sorocarpa]|uniref:Uncharacterized protein n=1 Tax=Riccia sorocarpa TaxID=122646 RepID=A0ABD3GGT6_9MARC